METAPCSHLNRLTAQADAAQEALLLRILRENQDTVLGRRYRFSEIKSAPDFAKTVPFSVFEDYEELIERTVNGEDGIFMAAKPYFYCISSGSTGVPKFLPLSEESARVQHVYLDGVLDGMIQARHAPDEPICRFPTADVFCTHMPDGTANGVRSGLAPVYAREKGDFPFAQYYAPEAVLFPEKLTDMLYVKLRFALARRDITDIEGVFVHQLTWMFHFMKEHWEELLDDMETGRVSQGFAVDEEWKAYLLQTLPPDPERAAELRAVDFSSDCPIKEIWPNVRLVRMIFGVQYRNYETILRRTIGDLPVNSFAYAATEGFLGIAWGMDSSGTYLLLPDACYFEFLPEDGGGKPLGLTELEQGQRYELLITTVSGLYRYRIGDVVEVTGFVGKAPLVRVLYRKNQILSVIDEKYTASQFEDAMQLFLRYCKLSASGFCISGGIRGDEPIYRLFLETDSVLPPDAEELFDDCLRLNSLGYRSARNMNEIGPPSIALVDAGSFRAFEQIRAARRRRSEQAKPLWVAISDEEISFFEGRIKTC